MKIGYIPLFFIIAAVIFAQEEDSVSVYQLDQISVTATRSQISVFDAPNQLVSVNTDDLINRADRLVPDLFQSSASVYMQKTNFGGGAPIIRGFLGNQVLILVDGIRLNNSTFRYGPNQYLNTIDPSFIQNIEVLHGPSSVLYGSDALGGVINIITKKPSQATSEISSTTRTSTADESIYQNLNYHGTAGRFSYSLGGTYRNFNNLSAGGDVGTQPHTNFFGYDANASLNYQLNDNERLFLSYQFTKQDDVPRTDRLTSGTDLKNFFSPQIRQLAYVNYKGQNITPFLSSISATASFNFQEEGREIISSSTPNLESNDFDKVQTIGAQVIASSKFDLNKLIYGLEFYRDRVNSERELKNLTTGEVTDEKGRFTNNSNYQTIGVFLQDRISLGDFVLSAGARYTNFQFDGNVGEPFGQVSSNKGDFTFSSSLTYSIIPQNLNLILSYSQGFRAPNVDDITSFGKSGSGNAARYDTPNPKLAAEKSNNYEVGFKFRFSNFEASSFVYYSKVTDLLEPKPTTYNGADSLFGFATYSRANVGEAEIFGWDAYLQWNPMPEWLFSFNASYSQGNNLTEGEPLSRIPPFNGYAAVTWFQDIFTVKYHVYWALDQDRLSARDKRDFRIGTGGTPGYVIQNISTGLNFNKHVDLFLTFENITNKLYKTHGSGLYSPGRSLSVSLLLRY